MGSALVLGAVSRVVIAIGVIGATVHGSTRAGTWGSRQRSSRRVVIAIGVIGATKTWRQDLAGGLGRGAARRVVIAIGVIGATASGEELVPCARSGRVGVLGSSSGPAGIMVEQRGSDVDTKCTEDLFGC